MVLSIRIPIVRPSIGEPEVEAAARVIRSGWLTQGPEVARFEVDFAAALSAPHAVAVANCTVAMQLALTCVGVKPGDDVVTVSHSFVATANAVGNVGARPVFCEVESDTFGMDPRALERAITPRTTAILCVHQIGMPCDLAGILAVADHRGLPVVEDAACAIGSEIHLQGQWERIGKPHGTVACFSLHPRKVVTTGDGGMLTTADANVAQRLRRLRQHGMTVSDTIRHDANKIIFEEYGERAFNYRMTDVQAAIGRPQLARLDGIIAERRRLADRYREALAGSPVFVVPKERSTARSNWQSYPLRIRQDCGLTQIEVMQSLFDAGVASKRGIGNAHQEPAYADPLSWACGPDGCGEGHSVSPNRCARLALSETLRDTTVLIPLFHGMTTDEQDQVMSACLAIERQS